MPEMEGLGCQKILTYTRTIHSIQGTVALILSVILGVFLENFSRDENEKPVKTADILTISTFGLGVTLFLITSLGSLSMVLCCRHKFLFENTEGVNQPVPGNPVVNKGRRPLSRKKRLVYFWLILTSSILMAVSSIFIWNETELLVVIGFIILYVYLTFAGVVAWMYLKNGGPKTTADKPEAEEHMI